MTRWLRMRRHRRALCQGGVWLNQSLRKSTIPPGRVSDEWGRRQWASWSLVCSNRLLKVWGEVRGWKEHWVLLHLRCVRHWRLRMTGCSLRRPWTRSLCLVMFSYQWVLKQFLRLWWSRRASSFSRRWILIGILGTPTVWRTPGLLVDLAAGSVDTIMYHGGGCIPLRLAAWSPTSQMKPSLVYVSRTWTKVDMSCGMTSGGILVRPWCILGLDARG